MVASVFYLKDLRERGIRVPFALRAKMKFLRVDSCGALSSSELKSLMPIAAGLVQYCCYRLDTGEAGLQRWKKLQDLCVQWEKRGVSVTVAMQGAFLQQTGTRDLIQEQITAASPRPESCLLG